MEIVYITGFTGQSELERVVYGSDSLNDCLEMVARLVRKGWRLIYVELQQGQSFTELPVDAFDGKSLQNPLLNLQENWEQILA